MSVKLRHYCSSISEEHAASIFRVEEFLSPENGDSEFLRNVVTVADYSSLYPCGTWTLTPSVPVLYSDYKFLMPQVVFYRQMQKDILRKPPKAL